MDCLIAEADREDAHVEVARPYPALEQRHILLMHARAGSACLGWTDSGRRRSRSFVEGDFILNPAGLSTTPRWEEPVDLLLLAICRDALQRAALQLELPPGLELRPAYGFRDQLLGRLMQAIVGEFRQPAPDIFYADTLAHAAMLHLLKTAAERSVRAWKGGLPHQTLRQVIEYMQANLAGRPSLRDLSALARISPTHFARAFRQSTGLPPHQWLLEQRLRRAEELLLTTGLSISDVASATGFADQSHLTRLLRRSRGITPSQLRR